MANRRFILLALASLVCFLLALTVWASRGQGGAAVRHVWEYESFVVIIGQQGQASYMEDGVSVSLPASPAAAFRRIQSLGAEGWEMTGTVSGGNVVGYWFKRPK